MHFAGYLQREVTSCIDLLLPLACPWCGDRLPAGKIHTDLCSLCLNDIHPVGPACCPRCMQPHLTHTETSHHCEACLRQPPPFDKVHVVGTHAGRLKEAIHRFKYRDNPALNASLGQLMIEQLHRTLEDFQPDLVMPVPSHPRRLKKRSYNQALELARPVARHFHKPLATDQLQRIKPTTAQQTLNARQRQGNLRGAFILTAPVQNQRILLIDDVMTTTATARECCQTLRHGEATAIHVAVLGRA